MTRRDPDVTAWCSIREQHDACGGTLYTSTGSHWWCACDCHPEPKPTWGGRDDEVAALRTWRDARARLAPPSPGDGEPTP